MNTLVDETLVVILGGGRGNRLFPLTKMRSKPAVSFGGKYRLIDIPISNCLHSGLERMFVLTQFNSASLNQHVARTYNFDSFSKGFVEVLAAEQTPGSEEWFQGTADAVRKIFPHIANQNWENILILSGDHLYRMNYAQLLQYHIDHNADITVSSIPISEDKISGFGLVQIDSKWQINDFLEKPKGPEAKPFRIQSDVRWPQKTNIIDKPFLASMGVYVFSREALIESLFGHTAMNDFGKDIIPQSLQNRKIMAFPFEDYWEDIGTIPSYFEANLNLCQHHPPFELFHPTLPLFTRQRHLAGSTILESQISNCIINDGCLIKQSKLENSVIGLRCYINKGSEIRGSLIMGSDFYSQHVSADLHTGIGRNARIVGAIIDKNAHIGKNVILENQKGLSHYDDPQGQYYIRDGIVIVVKGASIPNGTVV